MKFKFTTVGLGFSILLMVLTIPYTIHEYFFADIPFDVNLLAFSGVSIILFGINLYYHRRR